MKMVLQDLLLNYHHQLNKGELVTETIGIGIAGMLLGYEVTKLKKNNTEKAIRNGGIVGSIIVVIHILLTWL